MDTYCIYKCSNVTPRENLRMLVLNMQISQTLAHYFNTEHAGAVVVGWGDGSVSGVLAT